MAYENNQEKRTWNSPIQKLRKLTMVTISEIGDEELLNKWTGTRGDKAMTRHHTKENYKIASTSLGLWNRVMTFVILPLAKITGPCEVVRVFCVIIRVLTCGSSLGHLDTWTHHGSPRHLGIPRQTRQSKAVRWEASTTIIVIMVADTSPTYAITLRTIGWCNLTHWVDLEHH